LDSSDYAATGGGYQSIIKNSGSFHPKSSNQVKQAGEDIYTSKSIYYI
jgi:hypothetical protein